MTRTASKKDGLRALGARPVVADALDPDAVAEAVASAEPEVIVHQLTALSGRMSAREVRHPDRSLAAITTNRLRTEGTDHLLAAGRAVGARRFVAQSFAAFRFAQTDGRLQTEADPLDPNVPAAFRPGLAAILHLEQAVTTIEWGEGLVFGSRARPGLRPLRYLCALTSPRAWDFARGATTGAAEALLPVLEASGALRPRRAPAASDGGAGSSLESGDAQPT
jgi:hypothetical protein